MSPNPPQSQIPAILSSQQAALALEASGLAIWDLDLGSGAVYLSELWAKMMGESPGPSYTTLDALYALVPEEQRPAMDAAFVAVLKGTQEDYKVEHEVCAPSGRRIWVMSWGRVVERDGAGRALRMIGTNRDITARKLAEFRLAESEARFRSAFQHSGVGMGLVSPDGRWLKVNDALCRITGYTEQELVDSEVVALSHPDDLADDRQFLAERMARGATDPFVREKRYLRKDGSVVWVQVHGSVLVDAQGRRKETVAQIQDISERKSIEAAMRHQAMHDPLTGLPNPRLLDDRLAQTMASARRSKTHFGLLYLDLDHFKPINDTWGHTAGDEVLKQVAQRLLAALRQNDTVARLGGDEFAVVASNVTDVEEFRRLAARLRAAIERPCEVEGGRVSVSASIGIAVYPDDAEALPALMRLADAAMYRDKRSRGAG